MAKIKKKEEMIQINKNDIKEVENWEGKMVPRDECKRIDGKYYQVNVDCFLVQNEKGEFKWTRKNTGRISYDVEMQQWELTKKLRDKPDYVEGIFNEKGDKGYFTLNPYLNVTISQDFQSAGEDGVICINQKVAEALGYQEHLGNGYFMSVKGLSPAGKRSFNKKDIHKYNIKKLAYNADENNSHYLKIIQEYNKVKKRIVCSPLTYQAAKLFGNYTFGLEAETCNGFIPPQLLGPLGIVPLKDGSLRDDDGREPYEYTTIPLSGELGLETVKMQFQELEKRCEINHKCSLHIHIGSIPKRNMEFVIALYKLCYKIQDEVFLMFPDYKSFPEKYGFHKNYCQKLPNLQLENENFNTPNLKPAEAKALIKRAFDKIYYWASDNAVKTTDDYWNLNTHKHPKGEMEKWNYTARYVWCNLNNYLFSRRETVEFRCHTPTLSFTKASNWLFITAGIIQFAEQFTNDILKDNVKYDLEHIMSCYKNYFSKSFYENDYSNQVADYLVQYIKFRKEMMKNDIEKNDGFGKSIEFKNDDKFQFSAVGLKSIY